MSSGLSCSSLGWHAVLPLMDLKNPLVALPLASLKVVLTSIRYWSVVASTHLPSKVTSTCVIGELGGKEEGRGGKKIDGERGARDQGCVGAKKPWLVTKGRTTSAPASQSQPPLVQRHTPNPPSPPTPAHPNEGRLVEARESESLLLYSRSRPSRDPVTISPFPAVAMHVKLVPRE